MSWKKDNRTKSAKHGQILFNKHTYETFNLLHGNSDIEFEFISNDNRNSYVNNILFVLQVTTQMIVGTCTLAYFYLVMWILFRECYV